MTNQEQQLIKAIQTLPGHTVQMRDPAVCVIYRQLSPNSIKSQSVWLGRSSTIGNLRQILEA